MADILDPANTADESAFDGIRDLGHTAAANAEIVKNPLYLVAEDYIINRISDASDRSYAQRDQILLALQFLTAAYLIQGGGATASQTSTTTTGIVTRSTHFNQTLEYVSPSTSHAVQVTDLEVKDRIKFLESRGIAIIDELTGEMTLTPDTDTGTLPNPTALLTDSTLVS